MVDRSASPAVEVDVLLMHGIWNARSWLWPLEWRLRVSGCRVSTFGYASVPGGPQAAVPGLNT